MNRKCPGSEIKIYEQNCFVCGHLVEFFSGESKQRCPKCKTMIKRQEASCADWCPHAEECFGIKKGIRHKA